MNDQTSSEIERWRDSLITRARSAGLIVVDRTPFGGAQPIVRFEGPDEDDDFFALLTAVKPQILYADLLIWDEDEIQAVEELLAGDDDLDEFDEAPAAGLERDGLLSRAREHLNEPFGAAVVFIADGVQHHLVSYADWHAVLSVEAHTAAARLQAATHEVRDEHRNLWAEQRERERAAIEQLQPTVETLEALLRADEAFVGGGGSDTIRRQYAQQLLRTLTGWNDELPNPIRGAVSTAAESAWRWWRAEGKPARVTELRGRLPELAAHATLIGTLAQRRRAAQALLSDLDPLGTTPDLVDELARAAGHA
jgi:hypothetical protein